jgi:2-oxoglutarate/2-oxoacid ferredoxin oxidoreductase subunit alpha
MKRIEADERFRRQVRQRQRLGLGLGQRAVRQGHPAHGRAGEPAQHLPQNIQGLPTWYEVRVSEKGWLGRRGGVDMMVAMNPQTWDADVAEIEPAATCSTTRRARCRPAPSATTSRHRHAADRDLQRHLRRPAPAPAVQEHHLRRRAVGAAGHRPGGDRAAVRRAVQGQGAAAGANVALHLGRDYAAEQPALPDRAARASARPVGERIFVDGNSAAALGCVYGGATRCAPGIPITPSSSVAEAFQKYCAKCRTTPETGEHRYAIVQAEDELASIGMVVGAGWNGARAFTATSGPGISLMTEFIGLAYFAEIPVTIINVQRGGPSTGMPTRTQQADLSLRLCLARRHQARAAVAEDPHECFEHGAAALDLADRLQTPVFVMTDLDIGMNQRLCRPFEWDDARSYDRGKVMTPRMLEAGKRLRPLQGRGRRRHPLAHAARHAPDQGRFFTRGTTRDRYTRATPSRARLPATTCSGCCEVPTRRRALVPQPVLRAARRSPRVFGVIYFGSTSPAMREALDVLEAQRHPPRRAAHARLPLPDEVRSSSRRTTRLRRRAEPRRADAHAAGQRGRSTRRGWCGAALRRHADHRALHRPGHHPQAHASAAAEPHRKARST